MRRHCTRVVWLIGQTSPGICAAGIGAGCEALSIILAAFAHVCGRGRLPYSIDELQFQVRFHTFRTRGDARQALLADRPRQLRHRYWAGQGGERVQRPGGHR